MVQVNMVNYSYNTNRKSQTVLISKSLSSLLNLDFKFFYSLRLSQHWSDLPPVPPKLQPYGTI